MLSKVAPKNLVVGELVHQQTWGLFCCGFPKDLRSLVVPCVWQENLLLGV